MAETKFLKEKSVRLFIDGLVEGTIFSVVFQKANGELRRMVCRTGVTSHLKGGESTHKGHPENITVFDIEADDYRTFNSQRVIRIKGGGEKIEACDPETYDAKAVNAFGESVTVK